MMSVSARVGVGIAVVLAAAVISYAVITQQVGSPW